MKFDIDGLAYSINRGLEANKAASMHQICINSGDIGRLTYARCEEAVNLLIETGKASRIGEIIYLKNKKK